VSDHLEKVVDCRCLIKGEMRVKGIDWGLSTRTFADGSVFVFVGSKMMECAFAAVKSVTELLPPVDCLRQRGPPSTRESCDWRKQQIHAAFSSANINDLDLDLDLTLSCTHFTRQVAPVPRPTE
jgi:hypothetical protein